jgi:hypothetical protein
MDDYKQQDYRSQYRGNPDHSDDFGSQGSNSQPRYDREPPQQHNNSNYRPNNGNNNGNYNKSNYGNNNGKFQRKVDTSPGKLYKPFVATGNRDTPRDIIDKMRSISAELEQYSFTLRVGGLDGPDEALETAVKNPELYLPFKGFNNKESKNTFNTTQNMDVAKIFQPGFDSLKPGIQAFLGKNVRMTLGKNMDSPAMFILCWTEDGAERASECSVKTGNMRHIIAIASAMKIPVFNLGKNDAEMRLRKYLELTNESEQPNQTYPQQQQYNQDRTNPNGGNNNGYY